MTPGDAHDGQRLEIATLRAENDRLIALLESHGIEWRTPQSDVVVAREPEPSRRPKLRHTRLAALWQVDRGAPLRPLRLSPCFRSGELGLALLGMEPCFSAAASMSAKASMKAG